MLCPKQEDYRSWSTNGHQFWVFYRLRNKRKNVIVDLFSLSVTLKVAPSICKKKKKNRVILMDGISFSSQLGDFPQSRWEVKGRRLAAPTFDLWAAGWLEIEGRRRITVRPSCRSRAVWGEWLGPEVGGASSCPAPHTALASVAGALAGRRPRPGRLAVETPAAGEEEEEEGGGTSDQKTKK